MRGVLLFALCGCNQIFDLPPTRSAPPVDARYFDAPPDAPWACWAPHAPVPVFAARLHQVPQPLDVSDYTAAQGWATGNCYDPVTHKTEICDGAVDTPLVNVDALANTAARTYENPRVSPDGALLFVRERPMTGPRPIVAFRRTGQDWTRAYTVSPVLAPLESFGMPSAGPLRRMMVTGGPSAIMREIEIDAAGSQREVQTFNTSNLPFDSVPRPPNLSADGLRMIVYGGNANRYALYVLDRSSLDQPFAAQKLDLSAIYDAFLTEDCSRIYFSDGALGLFYVERE